MVLNYLPPLIELDHIRVHGIDPVMQPSISLLGHAHCNKHREYTKQLEFCLQVEIEYCI